MKPKVKMARLPKVGDESRLMSNIAITILKCPKCGSSDVRPTTRPDGEQSIQCDACFHCGRARKYFASAVKAWNDAAAKAAKK